MSAQDKLVPLLFTKPWTRLLGGTYNPGERATFPQSDADEILKRGCAIIDPDPVIPSSKAAEGPDKNKMVSAGSSTRKKLQENAS